MRRDAFTIIEVLISVIILSISILLVVKIHSDNHEQIIYISERNKLSLQDSLFTSPDILSYHMDNRSVYDIIGKSIKIKETESREILKDITREIYLPDMIEILPAQDQQGPTAIVNPVMIKDKYSSIYYHFKIQSF